MSSIKVTICGIEMESPLVLASGILGGKASSMAMVASHGAGAVTTKSFGLEPRAGHKGPTVIPFDHGLINAVGLANPGLIAMKTEIASVRKRTSVPVFASIFGKTVDQFGELARRAMEARPDMIELNISCPNVEAEFGRPFGSSYEDCARVTDVAKRSAGDIPVCVKLTANCPSIGQMAKVCEDYGADAICAINTIGPGMLIDLNTREPVLSNLVGGVSGPAILPVAVKSVYEVCSSVSLPVIGTGGVTKPEDALQLIMAGATCVGIGSAVYYEGIEVFKKINDGLLEYLKKKDFESLAEIRGVARKSDGNE
jgi:dihydroorotate dehydrogenase (NAD+) catalytic subunit